MNNKFKYLMKNSILLVIGNLGSKLVSFILIPLYTAILSTQEYGIYDLLVTTESLIIPIITLDIGDAIFRFSMDKEENSQKVLKNGITVWLFGSISFFFLMIFIKRFVNPNYCDFIFYAFLFHSLNTILLNYSRSVERVKLIAISGILNTLVFGFSCILFLVVFKWGLYGYMLAYIIGYLIPDIVLVIFLREHIFKFKHQTIEMCFVTSMLKYSIPLIFASIGWWIISASDRYMVTLFCGSSQNGIYSIAYKIPNVMISIMGLFSQAWMISAIKEDDANFHSLTYRIYFCLLVFISIIIICNSEFIGSVLYSNDFFQAWKVAPLLVFACIIQGLSTFLCNILTSKKDAYGIMIGSILGACINIIFNFLLIPRFGYFGAAYSTVLAYILVLTYLLIRCKKLTNASFFNKSDILMGIGIIFLSNIILKNRILSYLFGAFLLMYLILKNKNIFFRITTSFFRRRK